MNKIYADGSPKGRVAIVIPGNSPGSESSVIGIDSNVTNNEAEYLAVLEALKYIARYVEEGDLMNWKVYSDSKLIINQSANVWKCKADNLIPYLQQVWYYIDNLPVKIYFEWIGRENNPAGILLEDVLSYERQVNREIKEEKETGRVRPYAREILKGVK